MRRPTDAASTRGGFQAQPMNPVKFHSMQGTSGVGQQPKTTKSPGNNPALKVLNFNKSAVGNHANITKGHSGSTPMSAAPLKGKVMGK